MSRLGLLDLLVFLATAVLGAYAAASVCPDTGEPPPDVPTLMASKKNPAKDAWLVMPDCSVQVASLQYGGPYPNGTLEIDDTVQRVTSVPSDVTEITFYFAALTDTVDLSRATKLTSVTFAFLNARNFTQFRWPPFMAHIGLYCGNRFPCDLETISGITFPDTLKILSLDSTKISTLKDVKLPRGLEQISMRNSLITSLDDFDFQEVKELGFSGSPITSINNVQFPSAMTKFYCNPCSLNPVRGIRWPKTLRYLQLSALERTTKIEVRESDLETILKLEDFQVDGDSPSSCDDPTANLTQVQWKSNSTNGGMYPKDFSICVISDTRFDELYSPPKPPPATIPPNPDSHSHSEDSSGEGEESPSVGILTPSSRASRSPSSSGIPTSLPSQTPDGSNESPESISSKSTQPPASSSRKPSSSSTPRSPQTSTRVQDPSSPSSDADLPPADGSTETGSKKHSYKMWSVLTFGCICVLAIAILIYRRPRVPNKDPDEQAYSRLESPTTGDTSHSEPDWSRLESLVMALRNDTLLSGFRIDQEEITTSTEMSRDGVGVYYKATYQDKPVVIRQILPHLWRDEAVLTAFLSEIRMCASLDHPRIVKFIGVASTSIRDMTAVVEFMPCGDLHSLLIKNPESSGREWFHPWTASQLKSKSQMASDIAEAIVYLHSFGTPIIHRGLQAKSVLVDASGTAKLNGFEVSRDLSVDTLAASEVGAVAWTAPEVLRAEAYDEKADIYSLGVLLVELDRCAHPLSGELVDVLGDSTVREPSSVAQVNAQLILDISFGKLHPHASQNCPSTVSDLIERCLSVEPSVRPSAMEVFYELRKAFKASQGM